MKEELNRLRYKIDVIDEKIIALFKERQEISGGIGKLKREMGLEIVDPERQNLACKKRVEIGLKMGVNQKDIEDLYGFLCKKSIEIQNGMIE